MATNPNAAAYMSGRRKYQRPQAMLWSENSGTRVNGVYVPNGYEVGSTTGSETDESTFNQFLILSDDNRQPIDFKPTRIEKRERMINGRMRSYHVADKLTISTSWSMLPSRSFALAPEFNPSNGKPLVKEKNSLEYTSDGGAGGVELLDWYENHQGSFWVYLAYDKYSNFGKDDADYEHLGQYNQLVEMFFSDFSYSVQKRGGSNHDFWNISVTLEEA
jgi:hypothetical protein